MSTLLKELLAQKSYLIMGIINLDPKSFCPVGRIDSIEDAVQYAVKLIEDGAHILDIGAESTNPSLISLDEQDLKEDLEVAKIRSFLNAFEPYHKKYPKVAISIDTSSAKVISHLKEWNVDLINDVRSLRRPNALDAAVKSGLYVSLMHMTFPDGMHKQQVDEQTTNDPIDMVSKVFDFLKTRIDDCQNAGITKDKIIIDPGIGGGHFGKKPLEDLQLIKHLGMFSALNLPLCVGVSRKSFLGHFFKLPPEERLIPSLYFAGEAYKNGSQILRVHDVKETQLYLSCMAKMTSLTPI